MKTLKEYVAEIVQLDDEIARLKGERQRLMLDEEAYQ